VVDIGNRAICAAVTSLGGTVREVAAACGRLAVPQPEARAATVAVADGDHADPDPDPDRDIEQPRAFTYTYQDPPSR
jgi:hypothetical protein